MSIFNNENKVFEHNGKHYYADKAYGIPGCGNETMIFPCKEDGTVTSWLDLYCDRTNKSLDECIQEFINSNPE